MPAEAAFDHARGEQLDEPEGRLDVEVHDVAPVVEDDGVPARPTGHAGIVHQHVDFAGGRREPHAVVVVRDVGDDHLDPAADNVERVAGLLQRCLAPATDHRLGARLHERGDELTAESVPATGDEHAAAGQIEVVHDTSSPGETVRIADRQFGYRIFADGWKCCQSTCRVRPNSRVSSRATVRAHRDDRLRSPRRRGSTERR